MGLSSATIGNGSSNASHAGTDAIIDHGSSNASNASTEHAITSI